MKRILSITCLFFSLNSFSQSSGYIDSVRQFQQNYIQTHGVVNEANRKYIHFFSTNNKYRVLATFKKLDDAKGFIMKTSGTKTKKYFKYGTLSFIIDNKQLKLFVYQGEQSMNDEKYKNYLFVPYTDLTSGNKSYGGGKYLDFMMEDIQNNTLLIDFNKAYNPYCAYTSGYNCPIPPRENHLPIAIKAGEMNFGLKH